MDRLRRADPQATLGQNRALRTTEEVSPYRRKSTWLAAPTQSFAPPTSELAAPRPERLVPAPHLSSSSPCTRARLPEINLQTQFLQSLHPAPSRKFRT